MLETTAYFICRVGERDSFTWSVGNGTFRSCGYRIMTTMSSIRVTAAVNHFGANHPPKTFERPMALPARLPRTGSLFAPWYVHYNRNVSTRPPPYGRMARNALARSPDRGRCKISLERRRALGFGTQRPCLAVHILSPSSLSLTERSIFAQCRTISSNGSHWSVVPRAASDAATPENAPGKPAEGWWTKGIPENVFIVTSVQELVDELEQAAANDQLVVFECFAPWCGSCKALFHKMKKICKEHSDVRFVLLNFEDNRKLAKGLGIKVRDDHCLAQLSGALRLPGSPTPPSPASRYSSAVSHSFFARHACRSCPSSTFTGVRMARSRS